ncbi:MAG: tRNA (adenosine(37)-N6)-dimethylallyltransferase MiaA [Ekhidna sp.]
MTQKHTKPLLISIVGPTAVGKTSLAINLAKELNTEIVSADSRQFFKEMQIGTAKPTNDELSQVKHHFINSHSIEESYNAGEFGRDVKDHLHQFFKKKKYAIAVGGSSLYLKSLWEGFDDMPEILPSIREELNKEFIENGLEYLLKELKEKDSDYFREVDINNGQRIVRALEVIRSSGKPFSSFRNATPNELTYRNLKIGLDMDRELLFNRINDRMDAMIEEGLFEEAKSLEKFRGHNALQTVGYTEIFNYFDGEYDREEAVRLLKRNSRRYAKRQLTWFRRYEDIHWFKPDQQKDILSLVRHHLP